MRISIDKINLCTKYKTILSLHFHNWIQKYISLLGKKTLVFSCKNLVSAEGKAYKNKKKFKNKKI